jgi:Tol biopolymer transport system component
VVSGDASTVVFSSPDRLVAGDTNSQVDIYAVDRATGATELVSVGPAGQQSLAASADPVVSADGRYVAWTASLRLFDSSQPTNFPSIWLRDRMAGSTRLITPVATNGASLYPSISGDGGIVAFDSTATNLVPGDTNAKTDVFVWQRNTDTLRRVSLTAGGLELAETSADPVVSADGSTVAFVSSARFVAEDINTGNDLYVKRLASGAITLASPAPNSAAASGQVDFAVPSISSNGNVVAFTAVGPLVSSDTNGLNDIYLRDVTAGVTTRVSVSSNGVQGNGVSNNPSISADGSRVVFDTNADNLVAGDTNGTTDVMQHDRATSRTVRVSTNTDGSQHSEQARNPSSSADGLTVVFDFQNVVFGKYLGT